MDKYISGYTPRAQSTHWNYVTSRHPDNKFAQVNSLKKNYHYTTNEAWEVYEKFSGELRDSGQTLGDILSKALDARKPQVDEKKNYIVTDLAGANMLVGDEAKTFLNAADRLGIERQGYRVYVEVQS